MGTAGFADAAEDGRQASAVRPAFDLCGPLPTGTVVLEASAGTGKTHTIAALATRYVADGAARLDQLMLVTFGRAATNELRQRVRDRLVRAEALLAESTGGGPQARDDLDALLLAGSAEERAGRHSRLAAALADFDAATIATTHQFCLAMLDGLGVLGDHEPQARFVEHVRELTDEVVTDEYLRRYADLERPAWEYADALAVAHRAVAAPHTQLVPAAADVETRAGERVRFAARVREVVERRKRDGRLFTYDDMLTRLRDSLADPSYGEAAAARLRSRYRVVMVDEFQDTDPIQWEILRRTFHGHGTLVLIGDPKQSIYAFRGADVYSYLDAVRSAGTVATLDTNWRSDQALVDALEPLLEGAALGEEEILVRRVTAAHRTRRLVGSDPELAAPVRLRVLPHHGPPEDTPAVAAVRASLSADVVADISAVLASDTRLVIDPEPRAPRRGAVPDTRPVRASDIAVVVRRNERGEAICRALIEAGVPAVMLGANSVFATEIAREWLTLLGALDQPRQQAVRRAALTRFVGWPLEKLAAAGEEDLVELTQRIRRWSRLLSTGGVAALLEAATAETDLPRRILAEAGGERLMTDLRHVAESLHAAMAAGQLGSGALLEWLRTRIDEAETGASSDGMRRLETDEDAVTVLTVHRSKGLEFPIVYLPEAWDRHVDDADDGRPLQVHEVTAAGVGACVLDVGGLTGAGRAERFARWREEEAGEDLRLLYVALTRARSQVVLWWAAARTTEASPLHRLLYRPADQPAPPPRPARAADLADAPRARPPLQIDVVSPRAAVRPPRVELPRTGLGVRAFSRALDVEWRRTSYSALTAAAHGAAPTPSVGSEPELHREDDEAALPAEQGAGSAPEHPLSLDLAPESGPSPLDALSPMGDLPSGAEFGTAVHAVFETVDPTAADLPAALRAASQRALSYGGGTLPPPEALAEALQPVFSTPLGPLAAERRLCDIGPADRLAELSFEYPLGSSSGPRLTDLAPLLARHLPASDPLATYPARLADPGWDDQRLRGYLNGSIDAVLRVASADGPRYLVVDYKTNWLGGFDGQPLRLGDYTPERMSAAMVAAHYPLQALFYSVAVHRLLRWRQPDYDPARHLGGVLYLFVRGMAGPQTPRVDGSPCGVFSWLPPAALITELSDVLDGSPAGDVR